MHFILPLNDVSGPVTRLTEIADYLGVDALVRAISAGLDVYDTTPEGPLLADASAAEMLSKLAIAGDIPPGAL